MINDEDACTWGISNDTLLIPADSIISDAVLTLHNVSLAGDDSQAALYVQLLDNPNADVEAFEEISDAQGGNFFEGYGTFLRKIESSELSSTPKDITISLNQINDINAWTWDIFDAPFVVTFADSTTMELSSSLLALLDYAGTGRSFGFGLDCDGVSIEAVSLDLMIRSTTAATPSTILTFQVGNSNHVPVLETIEDQTIPETKTLTFTVSATDADNDNITYTASNLPGGAVFTNQTFTWTPSDSQSGIYEVIFTAEDGKGGIDTTTVQITVTSATSEWTLLAYDDFESGWGNYTDGGSDCSLYVRSKYAPQGSKAADIQSNNGDASSFILTNGIDVKNPGYSEIKITFSYMPVSMDNSSEGFRLDYWDGESWVTLDSWYRYIDFSNFSVYSETVEISRSNLTFPTDMKIRFVCEASSVYDDAMIDEIAISAR